MVSLWNRRSLASQAGGHLGLISPRQLLTQLEHAHKGCGRQSSCNRKWDKQTADYQSKHGQLEGRIGTTWVNTHLKNVAVENFLQAKERPEIDPICQ
ncbi:hypothetical protein LEMLEM_LOCUS18574 [Lemmus lemmus]